MEFDRKVAWGLWYSDSEGRMHFCFEPGEDKRRVYLNMRPSIDEKMPSEDFYRSDRYKLGLERTKQYLVSCGYDVMLEEGL